MANTGNKGFTTLEEYYTDNNCATGITKQNACYLPEYVAPVYDVASCPVANTTISIDMYSVMFSGGYRNQEVQITSNYDDLSFSTGASWISINVDGYSGNVVVTINADYNNWGSERSDDINIYQGSEFIASIYVWQDQY